MKNDLTKDVEEAPELSEAEVELQKQLDEAHAQDEELSPDAQLAFDVGTMAENTRDMLTNLIREVERGVVTSTAFANASSDREKEGFVIALEEQKMLFGAIQKMLGMEDMEKDPETFFDRLVIERDELAIKYEDLGVFMNTSAFKKIDYDQRRLLGKQKDDMTNYLDTLNKRIELLTEKEVKDEE